MSDSRVSKLAHTLVHHATRVRQDETVLITATHLARPLVEALFFEVTRAGAFPVPNIEFPSTQKIWLEEAQDLQIATLPHVQEYVATHTDVHITLHAPENTKLLSGIPQNRLALADYAWRTVMDHVASGKTRWAFTHFPTEALAQEAGMALSDYEDVFYRACNQPWSKLAKELRQLKAVFDGAGEVKVSGEGTDLSFALSGRSGVVFSGNHTLPDGELLYAPVEDSVEGHVTFDVPISLEGALIEGVHLEWRAGRVSEASATSGEEALVALLQADEGARRLGEFGLGYNSGIDRPFHPLFNRKMGGTVHLTLGAGHPETGGDNASSVHVDLIKDLREQGAISVDGKTVFERGQSL